MNKDTGRRGKVNAYVCQTCRGLTVTVEADDGTTPFMISCTKPGCNSAAYSSFYRPPHPCPPPTHEWYRPTPAEAEKLSEGVRDHVRRGGLLMRPIGKSRPDAEWRDGAAPRGPRATPPIKKMWW